MAGGGTGRAWMLGEDPTNADRDSEYAVSAAAPATRASVLSLKMSRAPNRVSGMSACSNKARGDNRLSPTWPSQTN